jgi:hypothetical protein
MNQVCARTRLSMLVLALLAAPLGLSACANFPYVAGDAQGIKEQAESQTGSNLTRREKGSSGAREVDKDAIQSGMRGAGAGRDNGL